MSTYYQEIKEEGVERKRRHVYYRTREIAIPSDYFEEIKKGISDELREEYVDVATRLDFQHRLTSELRNLRNEIAQLDSRLRRIESPTLVSIKEMTIDEAKQLVESYLKDYLKEHEEVYPSDVADELQLRYDLVREIFDILEKEEKVKKKGE